MAIPEHVETLGEMARSVVEPIAMLNRIYLTIDELDRQACELLGTESARAQEVVALIVSLKDSIEGTQGMCANVGRALAELAEYHSQG
ncbi:hypothetical protein NQK81_01410 [Amycolatopsis roodepoortensis]|uniref:hypothetical protein n=1 Tax=Amycolatopsis roodepoortensis TaxID=700274 RepID=UPI00214C638A|nr:hypothetical protein [Amycolatopsis roodepoortensis]UUV32133.1 hypothetical protein NQK81_01410 [Amycolatopsis roodepoortensis]